jgi:hypothetical protein
MNALSKKFKVIQGHTDSAPTTVIMTMRMIRTIYGNQTIEKVKWLKVDERMFTASGDSITRID